MVPDFLYPVAYYTRASKRSGNGLAPTGSLTAPYVFVSGICVHERKEILLRVYCSGFQCSFLCAAVSGLFKRISPSRPKRSDFESFQVFVIAPLISDVRLATAVVQYLLLYLRKVRRTEVCRSRLACRCDLGPQNTAPSSLSTPRVT